MPQLAVKSDSPHPYLGVLSVLVAAGRKAIVTVPGPDEGVLASMAVQAVGHHVRLRPGTVGWAGLHDGSVRCRALEVTELAGGVIPGRTKGGDARRNVVAVTVGAMLTGVRLDGLVLDFTHTRAPEDEVSQQRIQDWFHSTYCAWRSQGGFVLVLGTSGDTFFQRLRRNVKSHGPGEWDSLRLGV